MESRHTSIASACLVAAGGPSIRRCDYTGSNSKPFDYFTDHPDGNSDTFLPGACAHEVGGVIGANADADGVNQFTDRMSVFSATIRPRATGMHTFWVEAGGGSLLYIVFWDGKDLVVDNSGKHAAQWRHGSVLLRKEYEYGLRVMWANSREKGKLRVEFEDPLTGTKALESLTPLLVHESPVDGGRPALNEVCLLACY